MYKNSKESKISSKNRKDLFYNKVEVYSYN